MKGFSIVLLLSVTLCIGWAGAKEEVQLGGTLTFFDQVPMVNPMSWDNADWIWKHGYDTGYYMEHLMMGNLQKGLRGTKQFAFTGNGSYLPMDVVRGELLERWEVRKKPLSIVFYLRKGVMWQEKPGVMKAREFVADDIVYSMTRLSKSRKATPRYMDFIDRWEVKDKHTLIMHMKEWNVEWGYHMAWGFYDAIQAPEQEKAPDGPGKWENACGTGPYMLTTYKNGHSVIYTKNPDYWDSEVIGGKSYKLPLTDKIVSQLSRDEATRLTALRTGKIDLMFTMNNRQHEDMKKTTPQLIWSKMLASGFAMIALRFDKKPFDDIRVRRALNMAIDRKALGNFMSGGIYELVNLPYPKTYTSVYTPLNQLPPAVQELYEYNPEKAKKLLAEAGYPNGFSFKCQYGGSSTETMDYLSMIVSYMAKIGVKMELDVMDYVSGLSRMTKKTHAEAFWYTTDFGPPLVIIRKTFVTGQTWNASLISDRHIDETYERLISDQNLTEKQRDAELKKLGVYILEQVPGIILNGSYYYAAWWPWVKNYYGEQRVGAHRAAPIIARIWIDQKLKKKMGYE
jgi:peptide/nickel transport system substrate-binding protein